MSLMAKERNQGQVIKKLDNLSSFRSEAFLGVESSPSQRDLQPFTQVNVLWGKRITHIF